MTETPQKTAPASAALADDESVEIVRTGPIEEPCLAA